MPRTARIDHPGLVQHVIVRGIERSDIFRDDRDRQSFLERLSRLLGETGTDCLSWALMSNHVHLLLRPRQTSLSRFMRRLLTGYATTFNLRHRRSGHLFQNRYKSIVCEEEPYLLELVRYIHLNPLRAGAIREDEDLDRYPWCGHSVLMGHRQLKGQIIEELLQRFSSRPQEARQRYRQFVMDGVAQGNRPELVGGGLRRSCRLTGEEGLEQSFDDRVLGSGDFVDQILQAEESGPPAIKLSPAALISRVAMLFDLPPTELLLRKRNRPVAEARSVFCYLAVREMGVSGVEVGRLLKISRAGVSFAASRGEVLVANNSDIRMKIKSLAMPDQEPEF
jgi:putative transposase